MEKIDHKYINNIPSNPIRNDYTEIFIKGDGNSSIGAFLCILFIMKKTMIILGK